ncbi:DUF397 domain-containing protein [Streptomyces sp. Je 1-369]|uniref:DUF397 domain-containing protein n=1 Tax=Streptomyces sp. Je 1-369 TaxID=2966192 RepID=UPI002286A90C|nr:DUF397 domain-containing protein [Streptomyces sp. Je 1-369]WAL96025.1 DUF397 domain-containing protein [Streptomyces sp. Je 1-369]
MNLEIVTEFRKSSYSNQQGDCLEIAHIASGGRAVRDSKDPKGPTLSFPAEAWNSFVIGLKTARPE